MKNGCQEELYHRELETLLKFGTLINSTLNIEVVLDNAMKWAEEFIDAEASSIYEMGNEKSELFIRLARGEKKEPVKGLSLKVGEGIAGFVVQTGQPIVIQDVRKEERFSDKFDKLTGFITRSMICVPLILRDKTVGAIQVLNKKSGTPFTDVDLQLLTTVAPQIAVAMENAKLYQRLETKFELTSEELKTTQEKLIRSERLAAMGHLVQGVAHEIRNPVTTIGGFAHRIKKDHIEGARLKKYMDIIIDESARLENLVNQVREFSEVQSADLIPNHLDPVLDEVIKKFETRVKKKGITLFTDLTNDNLLIKMDMPQLVSALSQVLENALDSMQDGGTIKINTKRENNHLLMEVSDAGCGIEKEQLEAVYDPFVTSKTRGAGLGLTMVHQIIMNHHGDIKISSELKKGTTVTIQLPLFLGPLNNPAL